MFKTKKKWARVNTGGIFTYQLFELGKARVHVVLTAAALASLLFAVQPGYADVCIQEAAAKSLVCTANDIQVAFADNVRNLSGNPLTKCLAGTTFSFYADFHVTTTATSRYDIGLYFATDGDPNGDGARSGTCSANMITDRHADPATGIMLGSAFAANLDNDACRDVTTGKGWGPPNGRVVTVRVDNAVCKAGTGGLMSLPNCTSWQQNTGGVCSTPQDTAPGSPSKCSCDTAFTIPVFVETGTIEVTKDANPASLPEPGGEFTFTVGVTNVSQAQSITLDRICDDRYGTIALASGASTCPAGDLGTIKSTTCSLSPAVTLAPNGGSYACSFKADALSNTVKTITDVVTVNAHDGSNHLISGQDSAQVQITSVPPTATVVKSLVGLQCADVNYRVRVNNTDPAKALTLTALSDDDFGNIATGTGQPALGPNVLATNCGIASPNGPGTLPATILVGGSYECDFRAHFCGGSHTDTVTATLNDIENNSISPKSNSLTVKAGAQ